MCLWAMPLMNEELTDPSNSELSCLVVLQKGSRPVQIETLLFT